MRVRGYAAGGTYDILARMIGQWLPERLGQPFVIENRPCSQQYRHPKRSCVMREGERPPPKRKKIRTRCMRDNDDDGDADRGGVD